MVACLRSGCFFSLFVATLFTCGLNFAAEGAGEKDNPDPWETSNRRTHKFNNSVDKGVLKPVARAFKFLTPLRIGEGINNAFRNVSDVSSIANQFMQGKPRAGARNILRVLINSTLGVFGIFDVASRMRLRYDPEDFGQTLAVWGVPRGPYFVIPFMGPSTVRDAVGRVGNIFTSPMTYVPLGLPIKVAIQSVNVVAQRSQLLSLEFIISGDEYEFFRNSYLQRRDYLIHGSDVEDSFLEDEF